jgi:hypothetical protein
MERWRDGEMERWRDGEPERRRDLDMVRWSYRKMDRLIDRETNGETER